MLTLQMKSFLTFTTCFYSNQKTGSTWHVLKAVI